MSQAPSNGTAAAPAASPPPAAIARGPERPATPIPMKTPLAAPTRSIGRFHPIPIIGHPESFYLKHAAEAAAAGDKHAQASHKVGQYVTTALDPTLPWAEKFRRFCHALSKYCVPPPSADESLRSFYQKLGDIVRRYAGQEAVSIARNHHEAWAERLKFGEDRETLEDEAEKFFFDMLGHHQCPNWCCKDAYLKIIEWRDYWV